MSVNQPQFPSQVWDGKSRTRQSRLTDKYSENQDHDQIVAEIIAVQDYVLNSLGSGSVPYEAEADSSTVLGSPLYLLNTGHVDLAQANHIAMARVAGFATTAVAPMFSVQYVSEGSITKADWTELIGTASLTPGTDYFLDPDTPGMMTATAPTASGDFVAKLGKAITANQFDIEISQTIRL